MTSRTAAFAALAVLCACSSRTPAAPATGVASVRVMFVFDIPASGALVVFHHPDGTVQEVVQADSDGAASATITSGALVTVAFASARTGGTDFLLRTIAGVEPGDALVVDDMAVGTARPVGSLDVTLPAPLAGATTYYVETGCGIAFTTDPAAALPVELYAPACGTTVDVLATALASDGSQLGFASARDVVLAGPAGAGQAAVALPAWRTDFGELTVEATYVPADVAWVTASLAPSPRELPFGRLQPLQTVTASNGTASLALRWVRGFADAGRLELGTSYQDGAGNVIGTGLYLDAAAPLGASRTVDLATALPPRLSNPRITVSGATRRADWDTAGADPALDAQFLHAAWPGDAQAWSWIVELPPGPTSFVFPELPPELTPFVPPGLPASLDVASHDVEALHGYRAFKAAYGTAFAVEPPQRGAYVLRSSRAFAPP